VNKRLDYYTTLNLHLSLEDWYNDGLTPEEAKTIIESVRDPSASIRPQLYCTPAGINNNWKVSLMSCEEGIEMSVADEIEGALNVALARKKKTGSIHPKL
jgi:hypothetical protein